VGGRHYRRQRYWLPELFKIECDTTDPIKAILLYLHKYKTLYSKKDWIAMGKDMEFEEDMESKSTSKLKRVLVKWIHEKTPIGLMATNGAHRITKAVYHGEAWQEIYENWYNGTHNTATHLLKNPTSILDIPRDSILYQGISVTVHYPKQKCWTKEIIQDLKSYSAAQNQQGILVGVRSWRDTVQSAMEARVDGKERGLWNWYHNHCLGNKKMYPAPWPIDIWRVYKTLCEGNPARDILFNSTSFILIALSLN
jgi:hypothetical protein